MPNGNTHADTESNSDSDSQRYRDHYTFADTDPYSEPEPRSIHASHRHRPTDLRRNGRFNPPADSPGYTLPDADSAADSLPNAKSGRHPGAQRISLTNG